MIPVPSPGMPLNPDDLAPPPGPATTDLTAFPVIVHAQVRWGDMDAFRHVNNTLFLRYFEMARVAHFEAIDFERPMGIGPILGYVTCRYIRPLTYPDRLRIGVRVTKLEDDRFTQDYVLVSQAEGEVAAVGQGIVVAYDYDRASRATLPPEVKRRILELEARARSRP
jgi:acyl-CoA thioester hydrolase